jgi:pyruvate kinase
MKAKAIIVFTESGYTAELLSCQRPSCPIYAFSPRPRVMQQLALVWGIHPLFIDTTSDPVTMVQKAENVLLTKNLLQKGDSVVVVSGTQPERGATNMMKLGKIGM